MFGKGSGDEPGGAALRKLGLGEGKAIGTKQPMACNSKWWSVRDLNPRPCACKAPALPLRQPTLYFPSWGRALIVPQNESTRNAGASRDPLGSLCGGLPPPWNEVLSSLSYFLAIALFVEVLSIIGFLEMASMGE